MDNSSGNNELQPQKNSNFKPNNVLAPCPVCFKTNKFHIRWNGMANVEHYGVRLEKEYDLKNFYGYDIGVCSDCGLILHDRVLYASNNFGESLEYYDILTNALVNYLYGYDLNASTSDDKASLAYNLISSLQEQIKQNHPEFPEDIDLFDYIKNCRQP